MFLQKRSVFVTEKMFAYNIVNIIYIVFERKSFNLASAISLYPYEKFNKCLMTTSRRQNYIRSAQPRRKQAEKYTHALRTTDGSQFKVERLSKEFLNPINNY